ncbi:MAG: D-glycerate dehydrogenase [Solirubrobacterales bacterium]|nr:D-glycerate dehydrogenase [Solirubrobacterales bacterium]
MGERSRVVVLRELLPAGRELLAARFETDSLGLDATREQMLAAAAGAHALVTDLTFAVDGELLDAAGSQLKVVANFGVGYDNVDLAACAEREVVVTNTPDALTNATAELALTLAMAAARDLSGAEKDLREGSWQGWDPARWRGFELSGATIGVVGAGRIGGRFMELVAGLGGERLYTARQPKPELELKLGAERVHLDDLLRRSDLVSLHLPGTPETRHLIDERALGLMKPTAVLVNTGRGTLVDSKALIRALDEGRLGAAGLDVFEGEPDLDPGFLSAPRVALAPHIGSATFRARDEMSRLVAANVIAVLDGREPPNPVTRAKK